MAELNTFDNRSVERISSTVRSYEKEVIRTKDQPKRRRSAASGSTQTVSGAEIASGGNGAYKGNLIDSSGEPTEENVDFIATPSTVYDLPTTSYTVAFKVSTSTLGSN